MTDDVGQRSETRSWEDMNGSTDTVFLKPDPDCDRLPGFKKSRYPGSNTEGFISKRVNQVLLLKLSLYYSSY